jgi:hypothetical protein
VLSKRGSRNPSEDLDEARIDRAGLEWALAQVREWRRRVGNGTEIDSALLGQQMLRLAEIGLPESLCGYVILGCEWLFRLRTFGPQDAPNVLARIEGRLLPILGDEAWLVTEALAPSLRTRLKRHRALAAEWEDEPLRVVVTEPVAIGVGRVRDLRMPPEPPIQSRRGPPPRPAPWFAGLIIERLMGTAREAEAPSPPRTSDLVLDLISALCGRSIENQEYVARRQALDGQELSQVAEKFRASYELFARFAGQPRLAGHAEWFRVVRKRLQEFGPRQTFPYDRAIVAKLVQAYRVPASGRRASPGKPAVRKSSARERRET